MRGTKRFIFEFTKFHNWTKHWANLVEPTPAASLRSVKGSLFVRSVFCMYFSILPCVIHIPSWLIISAECWSCDDYIWNLRARNKILIIDTVCTVVCVCNYGMLYLKPVSWLLIQCAQLCLHVIMECYAGNLYPDYWYSVHSCVYVIMECYVRKL
jgi:hypothetical protein